MKMMFLIVLCTLPVLVTSHTTDIKQEYFTDAFFDCDIDHSNFSNTSPIQDKQWLIPNGTLITEHHNNTKDRIFIDANFTLTVKHIDDDDFGSYFCVLVRSDYSVDTIRLGLNVDGPYFGDLMAIYSQKAMIGGIAGGSLFVILAGSCLVSHFKYQNRNKRNKAVDDLDKAIDGYDLQAYNNVGAELDDDITTKSAGVRNGDGAGVNDNRI